MNVSILVATRGSDDWALLARRRAVPSAERQGALEVLHRHGHWNETLAVSRNRLADEASGEWLCFLDADDELGEGCVAAMAHALDDRRIGCAEADALTPPRPLLLVPAMQRVDTSGRWVGAAEIPAWDQDIFDVNCACVGTLVPAALFRKVGGFPEWPIYEDWALTLACLVAGARLVPVPRAVYLAYENPQSRNRQGAVAQATYDRIRMEYQPHADVINAAKVAL